jgi:hypothetical protein
MYTVPTNYHIIPHLIVILILHLYEYYTDDSVTVFRPTPFYYPMSIPQCTCTNKKQDYRLVVTKARICMTSHSTKLRTCPNSCHFFVTTNQKISATPCHLFYSSHTRNHTNSSHTMTSSCHTNRITGGGQLLPT